MREVTVRLIAIVVALTLLSTASPIGDNQVPAESDDLVIGQWRLDVSKSKYSPGPGPKSETRTYRATDDGIRAIISRTHHDGRVETIEYAANHDSVNHVIGTPDYDAVRLTRVNPHTSEATLSHAGKLFGTARRVVAADGMSMTIEFRQEAPRPIHNVAHYLKVP
jgi:hypothetical protein